MKTATVLVLSVLVGMSCFGNERTARPEKARRNIREIINRHTGGMLKVPNVQKGKMVFVDAQKRAARQLIADVASAYGQSLCIEIAVEEGSFSFPNPVLRGELSLFLVDDSSLPPILHAPESRWTMVNFARLGEGEGAKKDVFEARCRKELIRGFALLAGAQSSNYDGSIMSSVPDPAELDRMTDVSLPSDVPSRFPEYIRRFGIVPYKMTSYRRACEEGWALAPTNDIQKAIWDKVHSIPAKPLKIEYNEKRDKGK